MKNRFYSLCLATLGAFCAVSFWAAYSVFVLNDSTVYAENGPLENLQAALLAICSLTFLIPVVLKKPPVKLILLSCSWLCFSFFLRELDVERLNVPDAVKLIGSGAGRNGMLVLGFLTLLAFAAARFSFYKEAVLLFLKARPGVLMMLAGVLLFAGEIFEKSHSIRHNAFFEEELELLGFSFILLSAFAVNCGLAPSPGASSPPSGSDPKKSDDR